MVGVWTAFWIPHVAYEYATGVPPLTKGSSRPAVRRRRGLRTPCFDHFHEPELAE